MLMLNICANYPSMVVVIKSLAFNVSLSLHMPYNL